MYISQLFLNELQVLTPKESMRANLEKQKKQLEISRIDEDTRMKTQLLRLKTRLGNEFSSKNPEAMVIINRYRQNITTIQNRIAEIERRLSAL